MPDRSFLNGGFQKQIRNIMQTIKSWFNRLGLVLEIALGKGTLVFHCLTQLLTPYSLAWAEMRLIMTKVIWAFDLELTKNNLADWSDRGVWLLHEQVDLNVRLKPTNLP